MPVLSTWALAFSFAVLYAVMDAFAMNGAQVGYSAAMIASAVLLGAALLVALFIPKPSRCRQTARWCDSMSKVIVFGSLNMDLSIESDHMPQLGETIMGRRFIINLVEKGRIKPLRLQNWERTW